MITYYSYHLGGFGEDPMFERTLEIHDFHSFAGKPVTPVVKEGGQFLPKAVVIKTGSEWDTRGSIIVD